jgi:ATP-dependent protease ClpP protease subunit
MRQAVTARQIREILQLNFRLLETLRECLDQMLEAIEKDNGRNNNMDANPQLNMVWLTRF